MLPRTAIIVILADFVLLVAEALVVLDVQWRASDAATPHGHTVTGYAVSVAYYPFTKIFTMSGGRATLTSPIALDWVQVVPAILIILNVWFAYTVLSKRKAARISQAPPAPQM